MATLSRKTRKTDLLVRACVVFVLAGLAIHVVHGRSKGGSSLVEKIVVGLSSPFLKAGAAVHNGTGNLWQGVFESTRLEEENQALREELARTRLETASDHAVEALAYFTQEVSTNIPTGTFDLITVPVLSGPASSGRQISWIGAGTEQGITPGMIVLGPHGIIGEVDKVYTTTALVELVTDEKAVWGAEIEGTGELGLLRGTGDPTHVEMAFNYTAINAKATNTVVSSGMSGSIAPGGVPFGKVEEIKVNKKGEPVAKVRLPEDPGKLRTVFILPHTRIPFKPGEN